ncbi:MAG: M23 family metallopeptidase [Actinomycetota bacterium]
MAAAITAVVTAAASLAAHPAATVGALTPHSALVSHPAQASLLVQVPHPVRGLRLVLVPHPTQAVGDVVALAPLCGWTAPVDAPVVDPFRAPPHTYGPGNRGLEYGVVEGAPVRATAAGVIAFQGSVAGRRYVVIDHGGGVRSTYGPVVAPVVGVGKRVGQGQRLARAGLGLHLTVRIDGAYVDPAPFLASGCGRPRLVPPPAG